MAVLRESHLDDAVKDGLLSREQADALRRRAEDAGTPTPLPAPFPTPDPLRATATAAAALVAAASAAWLLLVAWDRLGGEGGFAVAGAWAVLLANAARWLERRAFRAAGAIAAAGTVAMTGFAVHGLLAALGALADAHVDAPATLAGFLGSRMLPGIVAAIAAALVGLRAFGSPILAAVLVAAVWFGVMVGAPVVFGSAPTWTQRATLSALLGVVALGAGLALDGRTRRDVAFWLYLSGLVAFWGGLATSHSETRLALLLGAAVNASLVFVAILLRRRVFAIFGGVGLAGVLGRVADAELADPVVPFVFAAIALGLVAGAAVYHRRAPAWERAVSSRLPDPVRRLLLAAQRRS